MSTFRILSLYGGRILGAFSAAVLARFEQDCRAAHGKELIDHFDLVTGTSTGGIIAIGLAMGFSAEQILEFYRTEGAKIFPGAGGVGGWVRRSWGTLRCRSATSTSRAPCAGPSPGWSGTSRSRQPGPTWSSQR